jgi:transcription elongation factor Elf1
VWAMVPSVRERGQKVTVEAARLRECPFCGSSHVDLWRGQVVGPRDNGMRFVRCINCGASTCYRQTDDAVASWNMRSQLREIWAEAYGDGWSDGQKDADPNARSNPYGT